MVAPLIVLDPLLSDDEAAAMLRLCEDFGPYGVYEVEKSESTFASEIAQRYDAAVNFVRTGGRFGRKESLPALASRTNYFRESYAYGDTIVAPGIEAFLHNERLVDAARQLYGRPVIHPAIAYANILLPGQELAVHTDVPEFRGANRKLFPQWLVVVMHHSELFEAWRMPIATGIAYFGVGEVMAPGGELAYYPDGASGPPQVFPPRHNTAVVLDTDSTFHGVDRVGAPNVEAPSLSPTEVVTYERARDAWVLRTAPDGDELATYDWDQIRFSVSWKAYCFADEAERDEWRDHADDLTMDDILRALRADLDTRGVLDRSAEPTEADLARTLIDQYVHFPASQPLDA